MSPEDNVTRWVPEDDAPDHDSVSERAERRADALLSDYGAAALARHGYPIRLTFPEEGDR